MLIPPQVSPANTFARTEIPPAAGRLLGSQIPVSNRVLWSVNGASSGAVATGTAYAFVNDATNGKGSYRSKHYLAYDCSEIRLVFCNSGQDPGASSVNGQEIPPWANSDLGTSIVVHASIEYPWAGVTQIVPIFFAGRNSVTIDEGGYVLSDPVNLQFLKSNQAFLYVRTYVQATTSTYWPVFAEQSGFDGEGYVTNSDLTPVGSGGGFTASAQGMYGPIMIIGTVAPRNQVVLACIGDSILSGAHNRTKDGSLQAISVQWATNDRSFLDFANGAGSPKFPLVKISRSGLLAQAEAQNLNSANSFRQTCRKMLIMNCTHAFVLLGTNDINNGRTAAQVETDLTAVYNTCKLLGMKVIACTIPPRTTSSDNWATAGNQTVSVVTVSGATNATPIVVATASAHGLADGNQITIAGVTGNTNANGTNYAKETGQDTTHFALYQDAGLTTPIAGNGTFGGTATVDCRERVRVLVNTWIRNTAQTLTATYGGPLVDYVYDTCATVEVNSSNTLTQNGGRWITTGVAKHATDDGIHPSWDGNQTYIGTDSALTTLLNGLTV